jgi:di/tricarboxylate transporter
MNYEEIRKNGRNMYLFIYWSLLLSSQSEVEHLPGSSIVPLLLASILLLLVVVLLHMVLTRGVDLASRRGGGKGEEEVEMRCIVVKDVELLGLLWNFFPFLYRLPERNALLSQVLFILHQLMSVSRQTLTSVPWPTKLLTFITNKQTNKQVQIRGNYYYHFAPNY